MNFMHDSLLPCITGPYRIESTAQRHILDCITHYEQLRDKKFWGLMGLSLIQRKRKNLRSIDEQGF